MKVFCCLFMIIIMIIPSLTSADVFGVKMGRSPSSFQGFKLKSKLKDGAEVWSFERKIGPGVKGGERTKYVELIFTDGGLSEVFISYFGHGKNISQATEDYSYNEKYIAHLLMLDPEMYGKYKYYGKSEYLGPNHRLYKSFDPKHNVDNLCEIETILGPKNGEEFETRIHVVFTNSKICGSGPVFYK